MKKPKAKPLDGKPVPVRRPKAIAAPEKPSEAIRLSFGDLPPPPPTGDPCEHIAWRGFVPQHVDLTETVNVEQAAIDLAASPLVAIAKRIVEEPPPADKAVLLIVFRDRILASPGMTGHMPRIAAALESLAQTKMSALQAELDEPGGIFSKHC